jgi:pimeloyl-ACP methyl ester carboxylesterase
MSIAPATYTPTAPSRWIDLDGPVHYVDHGGPVDAPLLVCVHGLGGSHANWAALAPLLTDHYRVLALDLAGFGLTAGSPRSASVEGNRELLHRFLTALTDRPAILVGNSMGGLITALQAAEEPQTVSAAVLIDPALPLPIGLPDRMVLSTFAPYGLPGPARRAMAGRRKPPAVGSSALLQLLRLILAEPSRVSQDLIDQHIALARRRSTVPNADTDSLAAARSLAWALARRRRYAAMLRRLTMPVMLIHGERDRLIPLRAARHAAAANPSWRFEVATGVGHVPMLEAPVWTAGRLLNWLPTALATG